MIKLISEDIANSRFIAYIVLMTIMALTAHAWIPPSSVLMPYAPLLKIGLLALPLFLLLVGTRHRWPKNSILIQLPALVFYGTIVQRSISAFLQG